MSGGWAMDGLMDGVKQGQRLPLISLRWCSAHQIRGLEGNGAITCVSSICKALYGQMGDYIIQSYNTGSGRE